MKLAQRWLLAAALLATVARAQAAPPDIRQFTSANIKTLTMDTRIVEENRAELQKIGGDFANAYRIHNVALSYAQPGKLHLETTVLKARIAYTINGNKRFTSIPSMRIHNVQDIGNAPGKKQTLLDSGVVPPEQLDEYNATFLRKEGGQMVYQLQPKLASERRKDVVWIDPKTRITVKRMNYNQDGKLIKWFLYKNPVVVRPGIYMPSRVEVYNPQNKLAGATLYSNIKANLPLDMSLFDF